ncbi:hypothetical protein G6F23_015196 [Rhizopus arrhizus]|nr:hypothetical protein G6F23_015196 [Rhizopus arrhizus]
MVDHLHLAAALAGGDRSHQPGRAGADDHYIAADRAHALARLRQFGMMSSWIWSLRICTSPSWISTLKRIARWICWPHCSTKAPSRSTTDRLSKRASPLPCLVHQISAALPP